MLRWSPLLQEPGVVGVLLDYREPVGVHWDVAVSAQG
jgi:hypothetical protein